SATRTLPSSTYFLLVGIRSSEQLLSDVKDALQHSDPARRGEKVDRPRQQPPRREHEARGDHDDALGAGPEPDVAAQAESLGLRANVGDEEGAGDGERGEEHRGVV